MLEEIPLMHAYSFFQSFVAVLRGRIGAIGHEFQMHYTINVTENCEHKFATEWCDLQNSLVLQIFVTVGLIAVTSSDSITKELSLSH